MTAPNAYLTSQQFFGIAKEVTRDTPVTPDIFIPAIGPKWSPKLGWIPDNGLRGNPTENFDQVPSVRHDELTLKTPMYADVFPNFLKAILGSVDTVVGTVAPYTHTIGLLNDPSTGSQPPSYTLGYFDGAQFRELPAGQLSSLQIDFGVDAMVECTMTWLSNIEEDEDTPDESYSTAKLMPGWDTALLFGTLANITCMKGSIMIDRKVSALNAIGQQGPYQVFAGPCGVTGSFDFIYVAGDTTMTDGLTRDQQPVTVTFEDPVSSDTVELQMSALQLQDPEIDGTQPPYMRETSKFSAVDNTTDAVDAGYAPIKTVTSNSQSSAY